MRYFIFTVIFLASVLIAINISVMDLNNLMDGNSGKAVLSSIVSLCVIVLMVILLVSKNISKKRE